MLHDAGQSHASRQPAEPHDLRRVARVVLVLIVNVVVAYVEIKHLVLLVGPDHGIVPAVPDLVLLWPGAQRKAG
ncbi:MAG TPA: hypothetical protein VGQ39_10110 [Pyrinomonadaceae bacterium]|nr:hypothetical protein [Pyrinomonadaceae bacterium]